jgi:hypothetical protein
MKRLLLLSVFCLRCWGAWSYYYPLTYSAASCGNAASSDFPALVSFNATAIKDAPHGGDVQSSAGADIEFFSDEALTSQLASELDTYNNVNGIGIFWVKITCSPSGGTIYMAVGNTSPPARTTNPWDQYLGAVWHLDDNAANTRVRDATANAHTGTYQNSVKTGARSTAGKIGNALTFNGTSDWVQVAAANSIGSALTTFTVSGWELTPTSFPGPIAALGHYKNPDAIGWSQGVGHLDLFVASTGRIASGLWASSVWTYVVATFDGSTARLYFNGSQVSSGSSASWIASNDTVGIGSGEGYQLSSQAAETLDEVRIASTVRSADWIKAEYNNQNSPGNIGSPGFWTWGSRQIWYPSCTSASISPASDSVSSRNGGGSFAVTVSPSGCAWTPSSDSSWLTVTGTQQVGSGSLAYSYAANSSSSSRVGNISVVAAGFALTQSAPAPFSVSSVSTTSTQAILQYTAPVAGSCSLQVADMNRGISIASCSQSGGVVSCATSAPHGLLAGAVVYLEDTGLWDGWQTLASASGTTLTFRSGTSGSASAGIFGVLIDDVNPALYTGASLDSRTGNIVNGLSRSFVVGHRDAPIALDGNRYSQALQAGSRHTYSLTCGTYMTSGNFSTRATPLGNTHNDGFPVDLSNPGQYAYPNIQWSNPKQTLTDPFTGLRSFRSTGPLGTASAAAPFRSAIGPSWTNPAGPLTTGGGVATCTGPCAGALLLRADTLTLGHGPAYSDYNATSLEWVQATLSASSSTACSGADCQVSVCLTVDGVSCASGSKTITLTTSPAAYTVGTQKLMDLWQTSGAPPITYVDVSQAVGTVSYVASTKRVTWASGNFFNTKWGAGSRIVIAGTEYSVASVQNERQLTLASGPASDGTALAVSANNFGVLITKSTSATNTVSVGYATFQYGSSAMTLGTELVYGQFSYAPVTVNGVAGNNFWAGNELFWAAADGSDVRDLGLAETQYTDSPPTVYGTQPCGGQSSFLDPLDGDSFYCDIGTTDGSHHQDIVRGKYTGPHTAVPFGTVIPDCSHNGNTQPCLTFTTMVHIDVVAPAFSAAYRASGYVAGDWYWDGSAGTTDDFAIHTRECCQDTKGWIFIWTLGDRTPYGTDSNSFRPIAATSSYQTAVPMTWCTIHSMGAGPDAGWVVPSFNDLAYPVTLTSATLNTTVGAPGGMNTCPTNPFGITGRNCTEVNTTGEPSLQNLRVGDLLRADWEWMRVLVKNSSTDLWLQRKSVGILASHGSTTLNTACGGYTDIISNNILWDYVHDPYGTNSSGNTLVIDPYEPGGHNTISNGSTDMAGVEMSSGGNYSTQCDQSVIGTGNPLCYQVRFGHIGTLPAASRTYVAGNPQFSGVVGYGNPNSVDSHPGSCTASWCLDSRTMLGGGSGNTLGSIGSPFTLVTGQLWKCAGCGSVLNRKLLTTMAYVGRFPLVDVSGPSSSISTTPVGSYTWCHARTAGECYSGSAANDVYVNAPYVSYGYCYYPGIGAQPGDANNICIGDLGANTGYLAQIGTGRQDLFGGTSRRIGTNYSRWSLMWVFWISSSNPSGSIISSNAPWLDGVRTDNLVSVPPPYPAADSASRGTFIPVTIQSDPPAGLMVNDAIMEFGYAENGDPGSFFCTTRRESCVAVSGAIRSSSPFFYEQTERYSGAACSAGCTVAIPALSQRVLYYRWSYRDALGNVIATSAIRAVVTP